MKVETKKFLYAGGFSGFLGSMCCLGPVILVLIGIGGVSTALSIGKYSLLFTILAALFFGSAAVLYLRKNKSCNIKGVKEHWKILVISFVLAVVFLIVLKYWLATLLARVAYR